MGGCFTKASSKVEDKEISISQNPSAGSPRRLSSDSRLHSSLFSPRKAFTREELERATNGFSESNFLGKGGFGNVHKGILEDGRRVAVKQLIDGSGQGDREFQAEVDIITRVHHRHLVSLVGYCIAEGVRMLVYEYVPNNSLKFHLHGRGEPTLDWPTRLKIALGSAKGLAYLHEDCQPKIIHRDIKSDNILLDLNYEAKIADFGLARIFPDDQTHVEATLAGTFGYLDPEYASTGQLTDKSDVYAFGVILLELVSGFPPNFKTIGSTKSTKRLVGMAVDEDGDIIDKFGNVKGHADPWEEPEEEATDLSRLAGCTINKSGNAVDGSGTIIGHVVEGETKKMIGKKVDGQGQIWDNAGNVVGRCELSQGEDTSPEGPFAGFDDLRIKKDGTIVTASDDIVGRVIDGDIKKLVGHKVDEEGDIVDKNGNTIGKAERWEPEEKERHANPMSGMHVNKEGEVRDDKGDLVGKLTEGNLGHCVGQEIDDNGNVVDQDGNKIGEVTLLENIAEDYEGPSEEELEEARKRDEERKIAEKMAGICTQTLERMQPICKQISEYMEKADRTPKEELDEEELVNQVKPLIEEGGRVLQECNGSLRGLDPDGHIAAQAKGRAGTNEATPEEYRLAETLKELTSTVVTTIDNAKKKLNDMPHAKKKLNPLWSLLTQPLFQILAAVGLLLAGVLGLVGQLLNGLGLGGLVNGLLGGLGIDKLLESFGLGGGKKKKGGKGSAISNLPVIGGLLGGK